MGLFKKTKEDLYNKAMKLYQKKDFNSAFDLFEESAQMGLHEAMYMLGFFHEKGYTGEEDREEAICWYKKALDSGYEKAKEPYKRLMLLHYGNAGVGAMNLGQYEQARKYFETVLEFEHPTVYFNYAQLWEAGLGGPKDERTAQKWYLLAAAHGHRESIDRSIAYYKDRDPKKWVELIEHCARKGIGEYVLQATSLYANGRIVEQDAKKAREYLNMMPEDRTVAEDDRWLDLRRYIEVLERKEGKK